MNAPPPHTPLLLEDERYISGNLTTALCFVHDARLPGTRRNTLPLLSFRDYRLEDATTRDRSLNVSKQVEGQKGQPLT